MTRTERLRLWIAGVLNRRDDVCWTDAVCWAIYHHDPITDVLGSADVYKCKDGGICYCGKFCGKRRSVPADFAIPAGEEAPF